MTQEENANSCPAEFAAIRDFLNRWQIEVSVSGYLRVQPMNAPLHPAELADLIRRIQTAYIDDPPVLIVFDFSAVEISQSDINDIRRLLERFANKIPARLVVTSLPGRRLTFAVVRRPNVAVSGRVSTESRSLRYESIRSWDPEVAEEITE